MSRRCVIVVASSYFLYRSAFLLAGFTPPLAFDRAAKRAGSTRGETGTLLAFRPSRRPSLARRACLLISLVSYRPLALARPNVDLSNAEQAVNALANEAIYDFFELKIQFLNGLMNASDALIKLSWQCVMMS